jgi:hypothetical protein
MILFYGAEFTRAYADYFTGKISPTEVAVKTTDKADVKCKEANKHSRRKQP